MDPDENAPLFTVGQVAQLLAVKQAFLRRCDELRVVSPQRSDGGQRRYSRVEIAVIQHVVTMTGEGMTMPAIRRIIELEKQLAVLRAALAETARERDELRRRLARPDPARPDPARPDPAWPGPAQQDQDPSS